MSSLEGNADQRTSKQKEQSSQVKRPMNAFMLWSKEKRRKISSVDPSLHNSHISKILGEEWKILPLHEKDPYIKQSKTLMERHKQEHPDYHYKPRQNKITKALKELSSLPTTLAAPTGFTPRMKTLAMSNYMPSQERYMPYYEHERPAIVYQREKEYDEVSYYHLPAHYPRPVPCTGCTCTRECPESSRYFSLRPYRARTDCNDTRSCYQDRPALFHRAWKLSPLSSPRYGWSVPILVNESNKDSKHERAVEVEQTNSNDVEANQPVSSSHDKTGEQDSSEALNDSDSKST